MIAFHYARSKLWAVMKRFLKRLVPLPVRVKLKWGRAAIADIFGGPLPPRVPPRRQTFIGGGDFVTVGDSFLNQLKAHGLQSDMKVLDVGCGQGPVSYTHLTLPTICSV